MKICKKCNKEKELDSFNNKGKGRKQPYCRECQKLWFKQHYEANKPHYLAKAKKKNDSLRQLILEAKNKPCMDCNMSYPYYVMEFDHRENKKFHLATAHNNKGKNAIILEIEKCDVVCSNCHKERTHKRAITTS